MPYKLVNGFMQFVESEERPMLFEDRVEAAGDVYALLEGTVTEVADALCTLCGHPERLHGGSAPLGGCLYAKDNFLCDCEGFHAPSGMRRTEGSDPSPFDFCKNCGNKVKKSVASEAEKWSQQGHCGKKCKEEWDSKHFGCCGKAKAVECEECDQAYECVEHGPTHLGYHKKEK